MTLKHFKVEEGFIVQRTGSTKWVWSSYKIHGSFDTREEADALLEELMKRPTGYTHYKITY